MFQKTSYDKSLVRKKGRTTSPVQPGRDHPWSETIRAGAAAACLLLPKTAAAADLDLKKAHFSA